MSLQELIKQMEAEEAESRICSECGDEMSSGFCIGDGEDYYCSDDCLEKNMTEQEYLELYAIDGAYWTEWE